MSQPQWVTPAGSLGTIPEGIFYQVPVVATAGDQDVFFQLIAGELPDGIQVTSNGSIEGIPKNIIKVQGVPQEVNEDVTSRFAIRAYTIRIVNGVRTVDRLADRTFEITVTGQDVPEFVTPAGNIGTFYDGTEVSIAIEFEDSDLDDFLTLRVLSGSLPPGLVLDPNTGIISGVIAPLVGPPGTATAGYDASQYDQYPFDFATRSSSKNYQFTLEITDGKESNIRTFEIFVYSKDSMSADTTDFTADNTFITADVVPTRTPVLLTPEGDLGRIRSDNFFAFKFDGIDFDGDPLEYSLTVGAGIGFDAEGTLFDETGVGFDRGSFSLPPGLSVNPDTGWFYGYIPDQGATEQTYRFAIRVAKANEPTIISPFYYFTITIIGDVDTEVQWLTPPNLGTILNGSISTLAVAAVNTGGRSLQYRLQSGSNSKLPQGLTLQPSGHITGKVSFNTFALDGGTTTFDVNLNTRLNIDETTFDLEFSFTVNAYAPQTEQVGYRVSAINIINGGSGYTSQPTVTISAPLSTENSIQATAGVATIVDGVITAIAVGNPGQGYVEPPTVTITGGGGSDATASASVIEAEVVNAVSVFRRFTVMIDRYFDQPYERLYIKCMPPAEDRQLIDQLVQNQDIIPVASIYRPDDPNFGISNNVIYDHAYGLNSASLETYINSLDINHYWRNVTLGQIETARALDSDGNVLYEVIYSRIIDNLVNNDGESVDKSVTLPYPVNEGDSTEIDVVYPASLVNMRNQVVSEVGQIAPPLTPALPLWMTSKQENGRVLGFTPAWVIAYLLPGQSGRIAYNVQEQFGEQLNKVDFKIDRYELDRSQTHNWDPDNDQWIPQPPAATTFDRFSRPSGLNDIGFVDYATTLAFTDINWRPMDYIAALGGIDGAVGRQLDGRTVIFFKQENFALQTEDEAFTDYYPPYDLVTRTVPNYVSASVSYDYNPYDLVPYETVTEVILSGEPDPRDGLPGTYDASLFDQSVVLSRTRRLAIYRMKVQENNQVTLEFVQDVDTYDYVQVRYGNTFADDQLYIPAAPTPGLSIITWSYIPETPRSETVFDGGSTRFINIADRWTDTDEFDKYLVFPRINILG